MRASKKHGFSLIYPLSIAPSDTLPQAYVEGSPYAAAILDAWSPAQSQTRVVVKPASEVKSFLEWGGIVRFCQKNVEGRACYPRRLSDPSRPAPEATPTTFIGTSIRQMRSMFRRSQTLKLQATSRQETQLTEFTFTTDKHEDQ